MPITEKMKSLLSNINGNNGIISKIGQRGRQLHNKGEREISDDKFCPALDALTKVFFKGPDPLMYVSIIHDTMKNQLCISYPGQPNKKVFFGKALFAEDVHELLQGFNSYIQNPSNTSKAELFQLMYNKGNDILVQLLTNQREEAMGLEESSQPNNLNVLELMLDGIRSNQDIATHPNKQIIASGIIDAIFPDIEIFLPLQAILQKPITIMSYTDGAGDNNYGVHVETKGIHFVSQQSPDSKKFSVGLARRDNDTTESGCCAACCLEFNTLSEVGACTVTRTADFSSNFPPSNFKASQNMTDNDAVFTRFTQILHAKCQEMIQLPNYESLAGHVFFKEASELLGSTTLEHTD